MHRNAHGIKECHWERAEQTWSGATVTKSLVCLVPHVCSHLLILCMHKYFHCVFAHMWASAFADTCEHVGARDSQQTSSIALYLSFSLFFFFLFVQRLSLNLKLAVWTSLVGQWAPGIPLSLIFSTGIADTHQLPDFYLILGLELRSYCLYSEHFTGWAISPVPHISVCLRVMLGIPPLQSAWPKILLLGSRETPQHQPSNCYSSWARLHGLLWLMTSME